MSPFQIGRVESTRLGRKTFHFVIVRSLSRLSQHVCQTFLKPSFYCYSSQHVCQTFNILVLYILVLYILTSFLSGFLDISDLSQHVC